MSDLDHDTMINLLQTAREGVMAMCDVGRPYCLPFGYVYLDGSVYISLFPTGRKWQCLQQNPRVCFSVFAWNDDRTRWQSVVIDGEILLISDLERIRRVVQANMLKIGIDASSQYIEKRMRHYQEALGSPDGLKIIEIRATTMGGKSMAAVAGR